MKRLAVYCGSATPADARYVALARQVGEALAARGIGVVYGGGRLGLMGAVARGALAAGGEVIGVIPQALVQSELANPDCSELIVVEGMHARKLAFTERSDGFLTFPGGVGTMDELWEAVSWAQLGYHAKPVGLLNALASSTICSRSTGTWPKRASSARPTRASSWPRPISTCCSTAWPRTNRRALSSR